MWHLIQVNISCILKFWRYKLLWKHLMLNMFLGIDIQFIYLSSYTDRRDWEPMKITFVQYYKDHYKCTQCCLQVTLLLTVGYWPPYHPICVLKQFQLGRQHFLLECSSFLFLHLRPLWSVLITAHREGVIIQALSLAVIWLRGLGVRKTVCSLREKMTSDIQRRHDKDQLWKQLKIRLWV